MISSFENHYNGKMLSHAGSALLKLEVVIINTRPANVVKHYHIKKGESHKDIIRDIIEAFRLSVNEASLFNLYCTTANGFALPAKTIQERTGINKKHVNRTRDKLVKLGLLEFDEHEHAVCIDWDQLRDLATLNVTPEAGDTRKAYVAPMDHDWQAKSIYDDTKMPKDPLEKSMMFISELYGIPLTRNKEKWYELPIDFEGVRYVTVTQEEEEFADWYLNTFSKEHPITVRAVYDTPLNEDELNQVLWTDETMGELPF